MKLDLTRRQIIDDLIHDAHFSRIEQGAKTSEVAAAIVDELHGMEASGHPWVSDYLDKLATRGASLLYSDWRRRFRIRGRTKKGTRCTVPAYAAAVERTADGTRVYTQLPFSAMTVEQVQSKHDALVKTRNTLSVEVRLYADLLELMRSDPSLATAGDALTKLEAA